MWHVNIPESAQRQWQMTEMSWANAVPEPESTDYCAHTLTLGEQPAAFRVAKTTPTKLGQFVTLWLRSTEGPIRPYDMDDGVTLFAIQAGSGAGLGMFMFPAHSLAQHGVLSIAGKGGKRAIRVYPPDVVTLSAQARRTQKWQCEFWEPSLFGSA